MLNIEVSPRLVIFLIVLLPVVIAGCSKPSATGRYMARFRNGVYGLQLVEASDQHLTGQLDTVVIDPNGKLQFASFAAFGVADGNNVSLSFKQSGLFGTEISGSGELDGSNLSLTGTINPDRISTVNFVRARDYQYRSVVNNLIAIANGAAAAKAANDARNALVARQNAFSNAGEQLVAELQRFDNDASEHLARWPHAEETYRQITAKMDGYLDVERRLGRNEDQAVKRGQIVVAIDQTSISTDQLHNEVQSLQTEFETNVSPLKSLIQKARGDCDSHNIIAVSQKGATACHDISTADEPFQQRYSSFSAGLAHLEDVYQSEHQKQIQIMREAQQLE